METPSADARSAAFDVDNSVSVIDASRCSARSTSGCRPRAPEGAIPGVPHAGRPAAVTADPAVATVYVAGPTGVTMIDARRCNAWSSSGCAAPPPTVPTGARPSAVEVDPGTHTGYVADPGSGDSGTISVFEDRTCNATDQAGCARLSTLPVPGGIPVAMAINSQTHTLYVATVTHTGGPDLISVFDAATCNANSRAGCDRTPANVLIANGSSFGAAMDLAVNRATNTIYATGARHRLGDQRRHLQRPGHKRLQPEPRHRAGGFGTSSITDDPTTHKIHTTNIDGVPPVSWTLDRWAVWPGSEDPRFDSRRRSDAGDRRDRTRGCRPRLPSSAGDASRRSCARCRCCGCAAPDPDARPIRHSPEPSPRPLPTGGGRPRRILASPAFPASDPGGLLGRDAP